MKKNLKKHSNLGYTYIHPRSRSSRNGFAACEDRDECRVARKPCAKRAECINTDGSFTCICKTGYVGDPYLGTCTWISTVCPAGQYLIGSTFNSGCADLPLNAKESFYFKSK